MLSLQTSLAFFSVSVLLALSPGPDNVFVLVHAAQHGVRAGSLVVLGLCSGLLFHTAAVALGLAALLASSPLAFGALKGVGAVYLLWLAWLSWRAPTGLLEGQAAEGLSPAQTYLRGIVMNATNPKVAIFFLAFLPQFVDPARGSSALQMLALGMIFVFTSTISCALIGAFAAGLGKMLSHHPTGQRAMGWISGSVMMALAARLAFDRR